MDEPLSAHRLTVAPARRTRAIKTQVFRLLIGAVLAPALLLAAAQTVYEYRQVERQQIDRLRLAVRLTATAIDQFVQAHAAAVALAASTDSPNGPPDVAALRDLFPSFGTTLVADEYGLIVAASPADLLAKHKQRSVADRDYFRVAAATSKPYVSDAFRGRGFGTHPLIAVSAPMIRDGMFVGIVQGSIDVNAFTGMRSSALRLRGQEMLVVDRAGKVIHASSGLPFKFQQSVKDYPFLEGEEILDGVSPAMIDGVTMPGSPSWVAWSELRSGWRVAIFEPRQPALAGVFRHAGQTAVMLLVVIILVLLIANRQINRIAWAVSSALKSLRAIAVGEAPPSTSSDRVPEELQGITRQVIQLAEQLQDSNRSLAVSLAKQEAMSQDLREANQRLEETVQARTAALEAANQALELASQTDPLTNVLNLRGLTARYDKVIDQKGRLVDPVGVLMLDVDFFKLYNDQYGHPSGDQVLRRVAGIALSELRSECDCVARVGGEEFLVLLPGADAEISMRIAERIRATICTLRIPHDSGCNGRVTVSIGVAAGEPGDPVEAIVGLADEALYRSKSAGRNQVTSSALSAANG